jgi:hypothetical protein
MRNDDGRGLARRLQKGASLAPDPDHHPQLSEKREKWSEQRNRIFKPGDNRQE